MADNNKYLDIVKNTAGSNWKPVNDAMTALRLTQMIIKGEAAYVRISIEDWFALGQPPAQIRRRRRGGRSGRARSARPSRRAAHRRPWRPSNGPKGSYSRSRR